MTGRQTSFWNTFSAQENKIDIEAAAGVGPSKPGYGTGGRFFPPQPSQTPNPWGGRPLRQPVPRFPRTSATQFQGGFEPPIQDFNTINLENAPFAQSSPAP